MFANNNISKAANSYHLSLLLRTLLLWFLLVAKFSFKVVRSIKINVQVIA